MEASSEVWAAGVTYLRSRDAREAESETKDVYARVYDAPAARVVLEGDRLACRRPPDADSRPRRQPVERPGTGTDPGGNAAHEIVGYCVGNDVSSRDIEGANPLYLPQAKVYDGSCALGPGIVLCGGRPTA